MTCELALRNLGLYSLQIAILIGVAALLAWAFRLRAPRPKLAFWHVVLAFALLLPVVEPWAHPSAGAGTVAATSIVLTAGDGSSANRYLSWPFGWAATVLFALALGGAFRAGLLALGMLRLRRLAERARHVPSLPSLERAAAAARVNTIFLCSEEIAGPVTFGFRNPVVLVPPGFFELDRAEQESVALHELLHVARRDWLYTLAEECVRVVLWFHPAIWFLLNRVQLAREQSVDEGVVRSTRRSEEYVGALLKIAAARIEPDLAPAPLFLKKRHLRERVAAIVQGVSMSRTRLTLTMIAVLSVLPVVVGILAWQIPLQAAPQEVRDAQGVEVNTGNFKVLHRGALEYPAEARAKAISGDVVVSVTVNEEGSVTDAAVVSGPAELRRVVLQSVLGWHFSTASSTSGALPSTFQVAVRFNAAAASPVAPAPLLRTGHKSVAVDRIDTSALPAELRDKVEAAIGIHSGEVMTDQRFQEVLTALVAIDSHLAMTGSIKNNETAMDLHVTLAGAVPQRIRVGGGVQQANLITKVMPTYPPEAKQARVQGAVKLGAVIGKDGTVKSLELISGDPSLVPSAMEAVKQWVYRPTLLNGDPVEVVTQIDVNYTLQQ